MEASEGIKIPESKIPVVPFVEIPTIRNHAIELASEIFEWYNIKDFIEKYSKFFEETDWSKSLEKDTQKIPERFDELIEYLRSIGSNLAAVSNKSIRDHARILLKDLDHILDDKGAEKYEKILDIAKEISKLFVFHCEKKSNKSKKYCKDWEKIREMYGKIEIKTVEEDIPGLLTVLDDLIERVQDTWVYYDLAISTGLMIYLKELFIKKDNENDGYNPTNLGKALYIFFSNMVKDLERYEGNSSEDKKNEIEDRYGERIDLLKKILLYLSSEPRALNSVFVGKYKLEEAIKRGLLGDQSLLEKSLRELSKKIGSNRVINFWKGKLEDFIKDNNMRYTESMIIKTFEDIINENTSDPSLIAQLTIRTGQITMITSIIYGALKYISGKIGERLQDLNNELETAKKYLNMSKKEIRNDIYPEREDLLKFKDNILDIDYGNWKTRLLLLLKGEENKEAEVYEEIRGRKILIKKIGNRIIIYQKKKEAENVEVEYEVSIPYFETKDFLKRAIPEINSKIAELEKIKEKIEKEYMGTFKELLEKLYLFEGGEFFRMVTQTKKKKIREIIELLKEEKENLISYLKINNMYEENKSGG